MGARGCGRLDQGADWWSGTSTGLLMVVLLADTELVPLRVLEHGPGDPVHRVGVAARRPEPDQPLDLGLAIVAPEIDVDAVLRRPWLRHLDEEQVRQGAVRGGDLGEEIVGVLDLVAERGSPELG